MDRSGEHSQPFNSTDFDGMKSFISVDFDEMKCTQLSPIKYKNYIIHQISANKVVQK